MEPYIKSAEQLNEMGLEIATRAMRIKAFEFLKEQGLKFEFLSVRQLNGLKEKLQDCIEQQWPGLYEVSSDNHGNLNLIQNSSRAKALGYNQVATSPTATWAAASLTFNGKTFREGLEFDVMREGASGEENQKVGQGIFLLPT